MPLKICCARVPTDVVPVDGWDAGLLGRGGVDRGGFTGDEAVDEATGAEADALTPLPLADGRRRDAAALLDTGIPPETGALLEAAEVRTPPGPGPTRPVHDDTPSMAMPISVAPIQTRIVPPTCHPPDVLRHESVATGNRPPHTPTARAGIGHHRTRWWARYRDRTVDRGCVAT
jgi:hypothetical protein